MKKYWKKTVLLVIAAMLLSVWAFGDPPVYFAKPIRGTVVDAETGKGLNGVVVVATWRVHTIGIGHSGIGGSIKTLEVVTDEEGKYFIPGWGPRPRPPLSYLGEYSPLLRYFKPKYFPTGQSNALSSYEKRDKSAIRTSEWDGKVIRLTPFKDDNFEKYSTWVDGIWSMFGDCVRECPRLVLGLGAESARIEAIAPENVSIRRVANIHSFSESDQKFLKEFKHKNK